MINLTKISILSKLSESNAQQVVNLKILYLAQKKLKLFGTLMKFEIFPIQ